MLKLKKLKKLVSLMLVFCMLFSVVNLPVSAEGPSEVHINAKHVVGGTDNVKIISGYDGEKDDIIVIPENDRADLQVQIPSAGSYQMVFRYYSGVGNGAGIERAILIDGAIPYAEAENVVFPQYWHDENGSEKEYDTAGNQIRPSQVLVKGWVEEFVYDSTGRINRPLEFDFTEGTHTVSVGVGSGELHLHSILLKRNEQPASYEAVSEIYSEKGYQSVSKDGEIVIEAEDAYRKSDRSMQPIADKTSTTVSPYSATKVLYNAIGGNQWKMAGQWIEWKFEAKESGLYKLGFHFKQSLKVSDISIREMYIDGKIPFEEAENIKFAYDGTWQFMYFSDNNDNPYSIHLDKGEHTLRLKVTRVETVDSINTASACLTQLNAIYRKIVVITGSSPDQYRDYELDSLIPEVFEEMKVVKETLETLSYEVSGGKESSQSTAAMNRLIIQLESMIDDTDKVTSLLSSFQENISSFGTWINTRSEQPLTLDKIYFSPLNEGEKEGEAGIFRLLLHYIKQFFASFVTDYNAIGVKETDSDKEITVWVASGRDQSLILKRMVNDNFTPETGISVNVQLVTASALLPSIVAGTGPDVYIGVTQADPVNLALRDAVYDLSSFEDYEDVKSRFAEQAMVPFTLNEGVYALPNTMAFSMLFVRTDIIEELGIRTEQLDTWEEILHEVLPELQVNSLSFGYPVGINSYLTMLYQKGGEVYKEGGTKSDLSSPVAIESMESFTKLYTQYGLPLSYDFANRFRSGEMPIGVADYLTYNQLTVFAPELKGLWTMLPVPGTEDANGNIDRSSPLTLTGSIILSQSEEKDAAWEFLKWWSDAETQQAYGENLESIVGAAARYNSATIDAVKQTQWSASIRKQLNIQMQSLKAYPEVPGGYLTGRYYDFAFRDIVYSGERIRETLLDATTNINNEIAHKRKEYNLD